MLKSNGQDFDKPLGSGRAPLPGIGFQRATEQPKPEPTRRGEPAAGGLTAIEQIRKAYDEKLQALMKETESKGAQFLFAFGRPAAYAESAFAPQRVPGPVQFILRLLDIWGLEQDDAVALLGFEPEDRSVVEAILAGRGSLRGVDSKDRIAALTRIRALLADMHQNQEAERSWLRTPRVELGNRSPLDLLREGSMENLLTVRQYVEYISGL